MPVVIHKDLKASNKIKQDLRLVELARKKKELAPCFVEAQAVVGKIISAIKE